MAKLNARMQVWLDTGANWALRNPVLLHGELGVEQGSNRMKVGDGATPWNALPYVDMGRAVTRTGAPNAQDNAYAPGTVWLDQAGGEAYLLHGGGPGAAAWARIVRPEELADVLRTGRFATGGRASEGYVDKAVSAVKLESARSLSAQGDARAEAVAFDGTKDVSLELTLSSVMTPGAYSKVTVDGKGRVVDGAPLTEADVPSLPLQRVEGLAAALAGKQSAGGEAGALHASFDPATAREMPASGDTLSTLWGKAARYLMDLGALAYKGAISRADVDAALEALLAKLDGVEAGAQVNAQADWAEANPAADGYIRSKPTALPADGGNADTVGGKSAEALMAYVEESLGAAGYGDMMRATYDADGDGVVDDAARLGGMAAADYAAAGHVHTAAEVGAAADSHTHTAAQIGAAATTHTHQKAQITDFPASLPANGGNAATVGGKAASAFALASHGNHVPAVQSANNTVFLRNDNTWQRVTPAGIGAAAASHSHSYAALTVARTVTLGTSWSGSGPYTQAVTVSGVTASNCCVVGLAATATAAQVKLAAAALLQAVSQTTNAITIRANGTKPTAAIPITVFIV